jgi:hypothetical protein
MQAMKQLFREPFRQDSLLDNFRQETRLAAYYFPA